MARLVKSSHSHGRCARLSDLQRWAPFPDSRRAAGLAQSSACSRIATRAALPMLEIISRSRLTRSKSSRSASDKKDSDKGAPALINSQALIINSAARNGCLPASSRSIVSSAFGKSPRNFVRCASQISERRRSIASLKSRLWFSHLEIVCRAQPIFSAAPVIVSPAASRSTACSCCGVRAGFS